jgi:twitching motility protein PilT
MTIIDSLLALQRSQRANALLIASGQVPVLEIGGASRSLSMPPLDDETVRILLRELDGGLIADELATCGSSTFVYEPNGGPRYDVHVATSAAGVSLSFRPGMTRARPEDGSRLKRSSETEPCVSPSFASIPSSEQDGLQEGRIASLLIRAVGMGCEDVILSTSGPPRLRIDGRMERVGERAVDADELDAFVRAAADPSRTDALRETGSTDFGLSLRSDQGTARFRANVFCHQDGTTAVFRPIRSRIPTLRDLGLPDDFTSLVSHPHGLVLLTGPAGAGKSTTLVSLIEHVNQTRQRHIITLEDPIEYLYAPAQSLIHQREVGRHLESFSSGLRAALRESPDIIVVGEMRDTATMSAALIAAETGHLVVSTLHAGSTTMAIERVLGAFPPHEQGRIRLQLAAVLRGVVAQVLLPGIPPLGRVVAYEKLVINHAAATKIREDRCHQLGTILQSGRSEGMVPFEVTLADLVKRRRINLETALSASPDPEQLRKLDYHTTRTASLRSNGSPSPSVPR